MKNTIKFLLVISLVIFSVCAKPASIIEYTVHHAPGGPSDRITRLIVKNLSIEDYIVMNRPGAAGRLAMKQVLKGESVLMATMPQIYVTNTLNYKDLEYDTERDLEILGTVAVLPNLLACRAGLGITTFNEFLNTKKSLSFAVNGYGSSEHIATEALFVRAQGKHIIVPYPSGGNKGAMDVLAGQVDCTFGNYSSVKPFIGDSRVSILFASHDMGDNILTWDKYFKESFPYQSYICLVVAKSMSKSMKEKIVSDAISVFKNKEFKETVFNLGLMPVGSTESSMTNTVLRSNKSLMSFIVNNKLDIS